jgi:hypothetical protein
MRTSFTVLTIAAALLVSACRSSIPEQPIGRAVPAPVVVAAAPADGGPWLYRPATQRRSATLDQQATIEIRQDTLTRTDTVSLHVDVAYTMFARTNRVTGAISAYRVHAGIAAPGTPPGLGVPFPFAGDFPSRTRQLELTQPASQTACASPAFGAAQSLRDLWFQPPDTLRIGTIWSDSSTYIFCRDGIPLRTTSQREFRVTAFADDGERLVLTIVRRAHGTLRGDGAPAGAPLMISGTTTGDLTYQLAPATGELLSASGTSLLEFTLTSKLRTQQVRQSSRLTVTATPSKK